MLRTLFEEYFASIPTECDMFVSLYWFEGPQSLDHLCHLGSDTATLIRDLTHQQHLKCARYTHLYFQLSFPKGFGKMLKQFSEVWLGKAFWPNPVD
jgi:hypothetical protein